MSDEFNEKLVLKQLVTTGSIAHQKQMRTGFPSHIDVPNLKLIMEPHLKCIKNVPSDDKRILNSFMAAGELERNDFRLGISRVFFQIGKLDQFEKALETEEFIQELRKRFNRLKWRKIFIVVLYCIRKLKEIKIKNERKVEGKIEEKIEEKTEMRVEKKAGEQEERNSVKRNHMESSVVSKKKRSQKVEQRPGELIRFDGLNHFQLWDNNKFSTRCKLDGFPNKTRIYCEKCLVHLCFTPSRNCFRRFHSK